MVTRVHSVLWRVSYLLTSRETVAQSLGENRVDDIVAHHSLQHLSGNYSSLVHFLLTVFFLIHAMLAAAIKIRFVPDTL